jgi:hypothetical protein
MCILCMLHVLCMLHYCTQTNGPVTPVWNRWGPGWRIFWNESSFTKIGWTMANPARFGSVVFILRNRFWRGFVKIMPGNKTLPLICWRMSCI